MSSTRMPANGNVDESAWAAVARLRQKEHVGLLKRDALRGSAPTPIVARHVAMMIIESDPKKLGRVKK